MVMWMTNGNGTLMSRSDCSPDRRVTMDRTDKPKRPREAADETTRKQSDDRLSDFTGRQPDSAFLSDASKPIGAHPRSEVTGRHDVGSGANETADGLTSTEEAIRRGAEDTPVGRPEREDMPVFDRGQALPKV
jgi:hypothetical protein